jgi:hypothetical protein
VSQTKAQLLDGSVVSVAFSAGSAAAPSVYYSADATTGVYFPGTGQVSIATSGTQRATVDASGRLLVGTSSSRASRLNTTAFNSLFQIESNAEAAQAITRWSADNNSSRLHLQKGRGTIAAPTVVATGDILGDISFSGYDGANMTNGARIEAYVDGSPGANDMPGALLFSTTADGSASPTQRMRITAGGEVQFQTYVAGSGNVGSAFIPGAASTDVLRMLSANTGAATLQIFGNNNGNIGSITTVGSSTSFNTSSDYRLKENIIPVPDAIGRLQQLKPSRFNFKADPDRTVDGFIAHEAQAIVPECATGEKDAVDDDGNPVMQGIDQSKLVPLLTAALQEAIAKIETLEARLTAAGIE